MTITITKARQARGYSSCDHLLDDSPLDSMIGRSYRDLAAAARAAGKLLKGTQDRRCAGAPVFLFTVDEDGNESAYAPRWTDGTSAV